MSRPRRPHLRPTPCVGVPQAGWRTQPVTHRALEVAADLGGLATERHHGGGAARPAAPAGGGDTGLVGFDDFPRADLLGVTMVAQDVAEIGRHAASLLSDPIDGDRGPARRTDLPVRLVDRGSATGVHDLPSPRPRHCGSSSLPTADARGCGTGDPEDPPACGESRHGAVPHPPGSPVDRAVSGRPAAQETAAGQRPGHTDLREIRSPRPRDAEEPEVSSSPAWRIPMRGLPPGDGPENGDAASFA